MTYQEVTGTLSPGAHPGSYNGQDAYNDMLVVDNGERIHATELRGVQGSGNIVERTESGLQVRDRYCHRGGGDEMTEPKDEPIMMSSKKSHNGISTNGVSTTLAAQDDERPMVAKQVVRRLTVTECERLQGYEDGWTDLGDWTDSKGKTHKAADTPRYKAIGNSLCLPFWKVLARRICAQYERDATMGGLFSGIGGFELVFQQVGAIPLFSCEIDEFCQAVLKKHFPEEEGEGNKRD
jgi:site-specific DNA-cytosine methylase